MYKPILRMHTCRSCVFQGKTDNPYRHKKCYCEKTKRVGNLTRGYYCEKFKFRQLNKFLGDDGIPVKNRMSEDYRTANQWTEVGRTIKTDAIGVLMHSNRTSLKVYTYYLIEQTELIHSGQSRSTK